MMDRDTLRVTFFAMVINQAVDIGMSTKEIIDMFKKDNLVKGIAIIKDRK